MGRASRHVIYVLQSNFVGDFPASTMNARQEFREVGFRLKMRQYSFGDGTSWRRNGEGRALVRLSVFRVSDNEVSADRQKNMKL
jgi:hypothetical protein